MYILRHQRGENKGSSQGVEEKQANREKFFLEWQEGKSLKLKIDALQSKLRKKEDQIRTEGTELKYAKEKAKSLSQQLEKATQIQSSLRRQLNDCQKGPLQSNNRPQGFHLVLYVCVCVCV